MEYWSDGVMESWRVERVEGVRRLSFGRMVGGGEIERVVERSGVLEDWGVGVLEYWEWKIYRGLRVWKV